MIMDVDKKRGTGLGTSKVIVLLVSAESQNDEVLLREHVRIVLLLLLLLSALALAALPSHATVASSLATRHPVAPTALAAVRALLEGWHACPDRRPPGRPQ